MTDDRLKNLLRLAESAKARQALGADASAQRTSSEAAASDWGYTQSMMHKVVSDLNLELESKGFALMLEIGGPMSSEQIAQGSVRINNLGGTKDLTFVVRSDDGTIHIRLPVRSREVRVVQHASFDKDQWQDILYEYVSAAFRDECRA